MSKRGGRVPRPATGKQWDLRFGDKKAADVWDQLCNSVPGNCARMFDALTADPRKAENAGRHHRLKGQLSTGRYKGRELEQWQYEITGGGRVWFLIDDKAHRVWLVRVEAGRPKATE